jgi:hypothetical protein
VWGMNHPGGNSKATHSVLLENETIIDARNTIFGRGEFIQKTAEDLALNGIEPETRFNVGALQLGYIRELARVRWATSGLGGAGTLNFVPQSLESAYGSRNPVGMFLFLRLRPYHVKPGAMEEMREMGAGTTNH